MKIFRHPLVPGLATVLIPFHNREKFLAETISSVLAQDHANIELILLDDGSTDDSSRVAAQFKDPRVRLLKSRRRRGKPGAVNQGLPWARGEWLAIFDSDDLMTPDSLSRRVSFLRRRGDDMAVTARIGRLIDGGGRPLPRRHPVSRYHAACVPRMRALAEILKGLPPELFLFRGRPLGPLNATLLRRAAVENVGWLDERSAPCEDVEYLVRLSSLKPIPFLDLPALDYRVHDANISIRCEKGRFLPRPEARARLEELADSYKSRGFIGGGTGTKPTRARRGADRDRA